MVCSFYLYSTSFVVMIGLTRKLSEVGGELYRNWNAMIKTELRMIISNSTLTVWPLDKDLNSSVMKISQTNAWILANDLANECMVIWFLDLICLSSITWWFDSWTYLVWWALPRQEIKIIYSQQEGMSGKSVVMIFVTIATLVTKQHKSYLHAEEFILNMMIIFQRDKWIWLC